MDFRLGTCRPQSWFRISCPLPNRKPLNTVRPAFVWDRIFFLGVNWSQLPSPPSSWLTIFLLFRVMYTKYAYLEHPPGNKKSPTNLPACLFLFFKCGRPTSWIAGKFNEIKCRLSMANGERVEPLVLLADGGGGNKFFSKKVDSGTCNLLTDDGNTPVTLIFWVVLGIDWRTLRRLIMSF